MVAEKNIFFLAQDFSPLDNRYEARCELATPKGLEVRRRIGFLFNSQIPNTMFGLVKRLGYLGKGAAGTALLLALSQRPAVYRPRIAAADGASLPQPPTGEAGEVGEVEEVDDWEVEKEKCSFCKAFLKSPCKLQFKSWSICVDKAKEDNEDFVSKCSEFTDALLECTSQHSEHFAELHKSSADSEDDNEGWDGDEGETVKESEGEGEGVGEAEAKPAEQRDSASASPKQ